MAHTARNGAVTPFVCPYFMPSALAVNWRNQDPEGSRQEGAMEAYAAGTRRRDMEGLRGSQFIHTLANGQANV